MSKVLLVDDNKASRLTLGSLLEDAGHEVDFAASLKEGQAMLGPSAPPYDVVLLDLHLGDGLGTSLVPAVRARTPGAKVLLMSGSADGSNVPADADLDGVLVKGSRFEDLLDMIGRAVEPTGNPR